MSLDGLVREHAGLFVCLIAERIALRIGLSLGCPPRSEGACASPAAVVSTADRIGDAMVDAAESPFEGLTRQYQDLLRYRAVVSESNDLRLVASQDGRRRTGSFYTPRAVARLLVCEALAPLLERTPAKVPRVLDPAMGTGVFLLEAARYLAERLGGSPAQMLEVATRGLDLDRGAREIAWRALALETGADPNILRHHLQWGNAWSARGDGMLSLPFDAVVGNPPWGAPVSTEEQRELGTRFPGCAGAAFDSFKVFLELGARLTGGSLAMVVPQAVLAQTAHAGVRRVLMDRLAPRSVIMLDGSTFPGAAAPACGLVFGPRPGPSTVRLHDLRGGASRSPRELRVEGWSDGGFPVAPSDCTALLERMLRLHSTLGGLAAHYRVRDTGINYDRAAVARRMLYVGPHPHDARDLPRFRGRDFGRYTAVGRGGWMRYDAEHYRGEDGRLSYDRALMALDAKLVLRQTADRLIATLDTTGMVMGRSVLAVTASDRDALLALLVCVNAPLLTVLYRTLAGEEGRILPQVKVARLHALPVPRAVAEDVVVRAELAELGRRMLAAGGADDDLEREACAAVCRVYELTADEALLVAGVAGDGAARSGLAESSA